MKTRESWGWFLIRLMVGWVFFTEGIDKFVYPALGPVRFAHIGIPLPHLSAPFVGGVEIVFGALVMLGVWMPWSCIPLLAVILTAIATTKIPFLMHRGFLPAMHEARTDFCMLLGLIALMLLGPGSKALGRTRAR